MFKDLVFCNKGNLSLIDITTMGDSSKRGDSDKIGKFDSGLKYALVILLRHGINVTINSNGIEYTFDSVVQRDEKTGKTKQVLQVIQTQGENVIKTPTAFAVNMGHEWELWMAIREIYSNCKDEDGHMYLNHTPHNSEYDTIITIHSHDLLIDIINNWANYFIGDKVPLCKSRGVSIYSNESGFLKIYKNGILVYKDKNKTSLYAYDCPSASIDEMRVLNKFEDAKGEICWALCQADNEELIKELIKTKEIPQFEKNLYYSDNLSKTWVKVVNETYSKTNKINACPSLMDVFMDDSRIDIGIKRVANKSVNWDTEKVKVEIEPHAEAVILNFEDCIIRICELKGYKVKFPIVMSKIEGMTCIADTHKKVIHVTENFGSENVWEIIKAHYRINHSNDLDAIYKDFQKLLPCPK